MHLLLRTFAQVTAPADTVVLVPSRDVVDVIMAVAAAAIAATFFAILLAIVIFLLQARRATIAIEETRNKLLADPAVEHLRRTAGHVEAISERARSESERLSDAVSQLSDRVHQASDRLEERIEDFNALLEVMQGEAEQTFVDGASRARGIRAGFDRLAGSDPDRDPGEGGRRSPP